MIESQPSLQAAPDALLLARFTDGRDQEAFAELVRRYGPVVRAACQRSLGAGADADDAFQAVFLILARKAATLRNSALLGPWLHTVAVRAANRARQIARRRQSRERQVAAMPEPPARTTSEPSDWLVLLDAEIQRLPDRLRVPLVLCEMEGKSRAETARLLGLNVGTLSSRLARGRDLLRRRLTRTGTIVAGAGLTAAFAYCQEAVPAQLLTTTQAALTGGPSASVAALTQGVLKAMLFAKLKTALLFSVALALLASVPTLAHYAATGHHERAAQDAKTDKEKLQGTWVFVAAQDGGKDAEGEEAEGLKKLKFVFKGDKFTAKSKADYSIDPSKKPKEFDLKVADGPPDERGTWKGIYELKGDELQLCLAPPNEDRPTEFATKEGEKTILLKLKREK